MISKVIVIAAVMVTVFMTLVCVACCKVSGRMSRMEEQNGK